MSWGKINVEKNKEFEVAGSRQFLTAAGFHEQTIDGDEFLVWSKDFPTEMLVQLIEALDLCEVISLELDRNMKVRDFGCFCMVS